LETVTKASTPAGLHSMTGYGRAVARAGGVNVTVELRSTNHRYLEIESRLPGSLSSLEGLVSAAIRARITRGRVEAFVSVQSVRRKTVAFDRPLLHGYYGALGRLRREFGLKDPVTLDHLLAVPQAVTIAECQPTIEHVQRPIRAAVVAATAALVQMRRREGERLAEDLRQQLQRIDRDLQAVTRRLPRAAKAQRQRLRARLKELLGQDGSVSSTQLEQAASLVKEADVHEEAVRLQSHLSHVRRVLLPARARGQQDAGNSVGKRLDFIAQELLREANTMGAKVNDAEAIRRVITMKGCIEKIREQVQNIE
jgi:uncharacterized protein (TIGR00255 family)